MCVHICIICVNAYEYIFYQNSLEFIKTLFFCFFFSNSGNYFVDKEKYKTNKPSKIKHFSHLLSTGKQ